MYDAPEETSTYYNDNFNEDSFPWELYLRYKGLKKSKCHYSKESFKLKGDPTDVTFSYVNYSLIPCSGTECETDPVKIAEYFANNPISFKWIETYLKPTGNSDSLKDGFKLMPKFENTRQHIKSLDEEKIVTVKYQHGEISTKVDGEETSLESFGDM